MSDLEYLFRLISECEMKEKRRFASAQAAIDFDNLYDKIERIVKNNSSNKEIIKTAAAYSPMLLKFASHELKKDPEIIMFALTTPSVAKYVAELGFDDRVLKIVQTELLNNEQERKNVFYALDGTKFASADEALAHNDYLLNVKTNKNTL